jgi:2-polyprenyl-3-methyl-5-hydroxy-6-metoxy-1,4-benzoquinol methylase
VPRGGRVLDLGCGEGLDSVYFASRGFAVTGVDALHAHIVFTDVTAYAEKGEEIDYFVPGELGRLYSDWLIAGSAPEARR